MPTVYTLSTTHVDNVSEIITATTINDLASAVNEISARRPMYWPRHVSQAYYSPGDLLEGAATQMAVVANRIYAFWMPIPEPSVTYDLIDINVGTAGAGGTFVRLMAYADDGAGGKPGTLLLNAGTAQVDTTGVKSIVISFTPPHGGIWLAAVSDGAPNFWAAGSLYIKPLGQNSGATNPWRCWGFANGGLSAPSPYPSGSVLDSSVYPLLIRLRRS